MESSVRRGEKVLKEAAGTATPQLSSHVGVDILTIEQDLKRTCDGEMKGSEDDSGIGQERSGSGSEEEQKEEESKSGESAGEDEGVYEIERILDYATEKSQYKVKWKDWDSGNGVEHPHLRFYTVYIILFVFISLTYWYLQTSILGNQ